MLEQIFPGIMFMLLEVSFKAILLVGLAVLVTGVFRKMSVHVQHRIWTLVLLSLLLLPLWELSGLTWSLPLTGWPLEAPTSAVPVASSWSVSGDALSGGRDYGGSASPGFRSTRWSELKEFRGQTAIDPSPNPNDIAMLGASDVEDKSRSRANVLTSAGTRESQYRLVGSVTSKQFPGWRSLCVIGSTIWLIGMGVMLVRLLIAFGRTLQFKRNSIPVEHRSFPGGIVIRESGWVESPVVVGWWKPCILLPRTWRDWTVAKQNAVFSHELSHLRRRDTLLSLLAELATLLYWFHPVAWLTKRKLSELAELACDEAAAIAIGNRVEYARYLVEFAVANRQNSRAQPGIAMARRSEIGQRVLALLDVSTPVTDRISRVSLAMILLVGMPTAILLAAVKPIAAPAPMTEAPSPPAVPPVKLVAVGAEEQVEVKKSPPVAADQNPAAADGPILTMKGTLLLPDGTVAKDAALETPRKDGRDIVSAQIAEGQFEIKFRGTQVNCPSILCRTADWNFQAAVMLRDDTLRIRCATPQNITLSPAKAVRVKVTDGGKVVENAHVELDAGEVKYYGQTDPAGIVGLKIPQNQEVFRIGAWTDDHKIGGQFTPQKPTRDQFGIDFQIEVSRNDPVRVQVINAEQKTVAGVPLKFTVGTGGGDERFAENTGTSFQTTDANGEAVFEWVPSWPKMATYVAVDEGSAWRKLGGRESKKLPDGKLQLEVAPSRSKERVLVESQLIGVTTDVSGLLVEFWSYQGEEENTSDVIYARTDAQGQFQARVLPGSNYSVFVSDRDQISNNWGGVIAPVGYTTTQKPVLTLSSGVSVEVLGTKGHNHEPLRNAWVDFESPQKSRRGRGFWRRTDEQGKCTALVTAGELELRVIDGDWESKKTVKVVDGQPIQIRVHRQYTEKKTITGKLVLPAGVTADLSQTTVKIAGMDGESKDATTVTTDAQGNFTAGISAGRISILAMSPEEKYFGGAIVNVSNELIEVPFHPTVGYGAQVLGDGDRPLPGINVRMIARLTDNQREYPPGTAAFQRQYAQLYNDRTVTTDRNGYFLFPTTPQRMELSLYFARPPETESAAWRQKWLEPGEDRPRETVHIRDQKPVVKTNKPLKLTLAGRLRDCRLAGIHALVVVSGTGAIQPSFVANRVLDDEVSRDILSYLPTTINGAEAAQSPDQREYFTAQKWPFPGEDSLFLVALNGDGQELGRLTLAVRDEPAATKEVAAFLKTHLPPRRDAKLGYEAALAEAKQTGRRLWVRVGQTRCRPCFTLSSWIDSQRELLSKDYVLFKFDELLDRHGYELSVALKFEAFGIPCHAILDADGKELINSIGPLGNIGDPTGDFEGIAHLRKMLQTTAHKLTNDDIESLVRSLSDD